MGVFRVHLKSFFLLVLALLSSRILNGQAGGAQANANTLNSQVKNVPNKLGDMVKGVGESFGYCPDEFKYTMVVYNDSFEPVHVDLRNVVSVQGVKFKSTSKKKQTIQPDGSHTFNKEHLCHGIVEMSAASNDDMLNHKFDVVKDDKKTYYYHGFSLHGKSEGEFMGPTWYGGPYTTSAEFNGVLFNNTDTDISVSFPFDKKTYKVTLEKGSFNVLSTDETNSIRNETVATFDFTWKGGDKKRSIPSLGLANKFTDPNTKKSKVVPIAYTYEVSGSGGKYVVNVQGFNIGNYNQVGIKDQAATTPPDTLEPIRDITPIECEIWYQSADQAAAGVTGKQKEEQFINYFGQLWCVYRSNDQTVMQQLKPGDVTDLVLIRPQVSEGKKHLFVFAIDTADTKKAQSYLTNVTKDTSWVTDITKGTAIDPTQPPATFLTQTKLPNGLVKDKTTGISGTLLLIDTFIPDGGGVQKKHYYQIKPSVLLAGNMFLGSMLSNLAITKENTKESLTTALKKQLPAWLATFDTNKDTLKDKTINITNLTASKDILEKLVPAFTTFLKTYGQSSLFTDTQATGTQREFNTKGLRALYLSLLGPISFSRPPLLMQAGANIYLGTGGKKPDGWGGKSS